MRRTVSLVCVFAFALAAGAAAQSAAQTSARVFVPTNDAAALRLALGGLGFDVDEAATAVDGLEFITTPEETALLTGMGFEPVVLEYGHPLEAASAMDGTPPTGYPDLTGVYAAMNAAAAAYPGLCQVVDLTTTFGAPATFEGRHIFAVKISDNVTVDEDEPNALVVSAHHVREIVTPVIALHAMDQFLQQYGIDPAITAMVDSNEIWICPVWNPDGYAYVFATDNLWRKNRRVFSNGVGVDLNRNYPHGWSSSCAGSTSVNSETYKGPSAASEAETQTMLAFSTARRFSRVIDFHSSGRQALWGYLCWTHPYSAWLQSEGIALSNAAGYGGAERTPSGHGENYQWQRSRGAHAFLLETHSVFQPTYASATAEATQVFPSITWLLTRNAALEGHVRDACTGLPLTATITPTPVNYTHGESHGSGGPAGRYALFLPNGTCTITVSAPGYVSATQTLTLAAATPQSIDFDLQPAIQILTSPTAPVGQTAAFTFLAPADPLAPYVAALGISGLASPGYPIGACYFPLVIDAAVLYSLQNAPPLFGFAGTLDSLGQAAGGLVLPFNPSLAGLGCDVAFVTFDPQSWAPRHVSPATHFTVVP